MVQLAMDTRLKIVNEIKKKNELNSSFLAKKLGLSRQTVAYHLRRLVDEGILIKQGSTKSALYALAKGKISSSKEDEIHLFLTKKTKNLQEDKVFNEISLRSNLKKILRPNIYSIFYYTFTEMLNNAIDHSHSPKINIEIFLNQKNIKFFIQDFGIGIFFNLKKKFKLNNDFEAIEHLLKGKQTTMPDAHSGQGIFFSSKIADKFELRGKKTLLTIDNINKDEFVADKNKRKGTEVTFTIKKNSRKKLEDLFQKYTNAEFEFDKTQIKVKLSQFDGLLSRSQAKRICFGLEKFKRIEFDFNQVKEVGQAFCDEIFRVFANRFPKIKLNYINVVPNVELMILRSIRT